jgi:hypothetical protein
VTTTERPEATSLVVPSHSSLWTGRYHAIDPAQVIPVQTSIGSPKWVGYDLLQWDTVKPWGLLEVHDPEEFRRRYRHRLHQRGRRIQVELRELELMYYGWPLVLCCFEDLRDESRWCHRRILAGYLEERLGVAVPDLEEVN